MTSEIQEFHASHAEIRKVPSGAVLILMTDKGQVVVHMTMPAFQQIARQTKPEPPDGQSQPVAPKDNPSD